jgi:hypothetical protein
MRKIILSKIRFSLVEIREIKRDPWVIEPVSPVFSVSGASMQASVSEKSNP